MPDPLRQPIPVRKPPQPPPPSPELFPGFGERVKTVTRDVRAASKNLENAEAALVAHEHAQWRYTGTRPRHTVGSEAWKAWVAAGRPAAGRELLAEQVTAKEKWQAEKDELLVRQLEATALFGKANWFSNFYTLAPNLVMGGVTDWNTILEMTSLDPTGILSDEEVAVAQDALIKMGGARVEDTLPWLEITPEQEEAVRKASMLEPKPPETIHRITVNALLKSLTRQPEMVMPEDWTPEQYLQFASIMDIPPETMTRAVDYTELLEPYATAISEQQEHIRAVLAGEEEWEMPDVGFWQKTLFTILSPMQTAADLIRPYLETVSYPLAGFAVYMTRGLRDEGELDAKYAQMKAHGYNWWDAMSEAYQDWDLSWYWKLGLEILTDPITYFPGLLLKIPGTILAKTGGALMTSGKGFLTPRTFVGASALRSGEKLLAWNRGLWKGLDVPFDSFKAFWAHMPKTFKQATKVQLDDFRETLMSATHKQTGKVVDLMTPDDLAETLLRAQKAFSATPMKQGDAFVDLGEMLVAHAPLTEKQVMIWSRSLGGKLDDVTPAVLESVEDVVGDFIFNIGSPAVAAKKIAATFFLEGTPRQLGKIIKDMNVILRKSSSRVPRAIEIGKTAKIFPFHRMTEYLVSTQKGIIDAVERSSYARGKVFSGIVLSLMRNVDRLEQGMFRMTLDRWLVRPTAEAYLGNAAYPIWNAFEGVFVSLLEGVVPRMVKQEAFDMMFLGRRGVDSAVKAGSAADVAGFFGKMPGREGAIPLHRALAGEPGPISLLYVRFPEKVGIPFTKIELKPPKWIAGKDWLEWSARKFIVLSDIWGTALRQNFLMRKMASYLAEYSYKVAGQDLNAAFSHLIRRQFPKGAVSKKSLGLTDHELTQDMFARVTTGLRSEVLAMHELVHNPVLMRGEMLKIIRQTTELSPQGKTLMEQAVTQGEIKTVDDILRVCGLGAEQSVADLRAFPSAAPESFRFIADQIESIAQKEINTPDDLMQVFQHFEVMADTASKVPQKLLGQVFDEADELKRLGKYRQLEDLWRTSRTEVETAVDSISDSLNRARTVIEAKSGLLTGKQQNALLALLQRNTARRQLQEQFLSFDGRLLDDFWALPKAMRTKEEHTALRAYRQENILKFKGEDAVLGAGDFLERKSYNQLFHSLPKSKLFHVDASARALSADDCAKAMGANVDALTTGMMESMTFGDKAYFIQMIKQSADANPAYFKGFTEDKIGAVYDDIIRGLRMSPEADIMTQKILQQVEGVKQKMIALRMNKSLKPAEEKALHSWIDDVAKGMDDIFGEAAPLPKGMVDADVLKGMDLPNVKISGSFATGKATAKSDMDVLVGLTADEWAKVSPSQPPEILKRIFKVLPEDRLDVKLYRLGNPDELWYFVGRPELAPGVTKGAPGAFVPATDKPLLAKNLWAEAVEVQAVPPVRKVTKGIVTKESWDDIRQKASESAHKEYYKAFADYTNENIIDAVGKSIFPFWTYHMYRWFFLSRTFLRKPGTAAAWGKYYEYSDRGYMPIPGTDLEFNPAVGSVFGATFSLTRHDFKSYYENLGFGAEAVDFAQRRGWYPGIHVSAPIALTSIFSDRPPELGEVLPSIHKVGLNLFVNSKIPGVADSARWLKDRVFHENFHEYYVSTIISNKQVEAGGKLIDGQSGADIWFKRMRGEKLTEEEQALWDEAYEEAAWIGILRSEFPEFRLRGVEFREAHRQVTALIEAQTGLSEKAQNDLWKHNLRPTDVIGGMPLDLQMALDMMWQWRIYFGRGAILMPPEYSDLYNLIDKYKDKVEGYQLERLALQVDTNKGFLTPTKTLHFNGREWRREYANNWSAYVTLVESLEADPEFADAMDAMTTEGHARLMKELGFTVPPPDPMREAIQLYFEIELHKKVDKYTGEEDYDYLRFWLEREACRMALPEEQRLDFDAYVRRYQTPMEVLFKQVNNTYLRGYRAVSRIVLEEFTDEEKALIAEYYADTTTHDRKKEIEDFESHAGKKLISYWNSRRTNVREALRRESPILDFWLYIFGYVTSPKTEEAKAMIAAWEKDRPSIVRGITESPKLEETLERVETRKAEE